MSDGFPLERSAQEYVRERLAGHAPDPLILHAWKRFYGVYTTTVRAFAIATGVPDGELDDFVQDVWITVVRELPGFDFHVNRGGLRTWLYSVVKNRAIDLARARRYWSLCSSLDEIPGGEEPSSSREDPADLLDLEWERQLVRSLLTALRRATDDTNYRIFRLRRLEGRSLSHIAAVLGLTTTQVRGRLERVDTRFRLLANAYSGRALGDPN